MTHTDRVLDYLERMTQIEPSLPAGERAELQAWYRSPDFTRDSDWPGWEKYLGARPQRRKLQIVSIGRRSA